MVIVRLFDWLIYGLLAGLILFAALAWRDTVRDGLSARIDFEDRCWYAAAPAVGYLIEALAGIALILHRDLGLDALAVAMGVTLLVAIHNAWDITVWSVTRGGTAEPSATPPPSPPPHPPAAPPPH